MDSATLEEMIGRLGSYRVLMLMQTILAERANAGVSLKLPNWQRLYDAANAIQKAADIVDGIFHGAVQS